MELQGNPLLTKRWGEGCHLSMQLSKLGKAKHGNSTVADVVDLLILVGAHPADVLILGSLVLRGTEDGSRLMKDMFRWTQFAPHCLTFWPPFLLR